MSNLKVNNFKLLKLRINKDEYWDFYLNKDGYDRYNFNSNSIYDKCLISYIDASSHECVNGDEWIYSKNEYQWENANTITNTLYNIGYTGVDNGLIKYRRDRINNKEFVDYYSKSKYTIEGDDNRLKLHAVSGTTLMYEYPLHVENGIIKFNGGFYQGFYKTQCDKYQVLPSKMGDFETWEFEFQINKCDFEKESDKTINDKYPNNKGIFFYLGTRAENKWIYLYDEDDKYNAGDSCNPLSYDDYIEDGHIDKKSYIIGNFYNVEPEYEEDDIDNYLSYDYYDESYYHNDWRDSLDDCLDFEEKPKIIDESLPHINLKDVCCPNGCDKDGMKSSTTQVVFFNACGCVRYKNVKKTNSKECGINCSDVFGEDDYIDDFDGIEEDTGYFEDELNIEDFIWKTDNGFSLTSVNDYYFMTDNKFLMFDRTKDGMTVNNWVDGTQMMYYGKKNKFTGNLFILLNRTKTGYTVNNIDYLRDKANNTYDDLYNDIYNNAFALRITDDGEIGYRYIVKDCNSDNEGKYTVEEGYSKKGIITACKWHTVHIKISSRIDKMKIYFYVDGKLKYITKELPKFNFHKLNDIYEKQEGVPYNISIGGGTQGLIETVQPNYMLDPSRVYPIEKYFAGTFIGYIKSFKFYNCDMEYLNILNNYRCEKKSMS